MSTFDFQLYSGPSYGDVYINQFPSPIPDLSSTICDWWLGNILGTYISYSYDYTVWFGYAMSNNSVSGGNIVEIARVRNWKMSQYQDAVYQVKTYAYTPTGGTIGVVSSSSTQETGLGQSLTTATYSHYETESDLASWNVTRQGIANIMRYGNPSGTGSPLANPYVYLCYGVSGYNQGDVDSIQNNMNDYGFGFLTYTYDFGGGCKVNIGGGSNSWEDITGIKVNVGGEWKPVTGIKTWVTDRWKDARGSNTPIIGPYM